MEEGTLAKWNVKEGDEVSSGDVIAEIETDKATMEVEAVDEGVVGKIVVAEGAEGVKVNAPIAWLLEDGESVDDIDEGSVSAPAASAATADEAAPQAHPQAAAASASASVSQAPAMRADAGYGARVLASPLAKRLAAARGISLAGVTGSGPNGRIVKRDIEAMGDVPTTAPASAQSASAPEAVIAPAGVDARLYPPESYTAVKLDGMRKVIARRLTQSFNQEVPHFPLNVDVRLDQLLAARKRLNATSPEEGEGRFKISVNDFVLKASALALKAVPAANATYTDDAILLHKHADIGVAVAIDGGLITPIVWRAEEKGLKQISEEVRDMASRARERKLKPEEYQGGTFSVSNLGMFGIKSFASIVNQPRGAIMSVGAGEQQVIVEKGEMKIATVMTVTLTCDHRVVDGAVGAQFLTAFKGYLEKPESMLL